MKTMETITKGFAETSKTFLKNQLIPLLVFSLIFIVAASISPVFLTGRNLQNLLLQVSVNMLISLGMLTVILTGGVDLSVGSILAVGSVYMAGFLEFMHPLLAMLLTLVIAGVIGAINGTLVSKLKIAPFIVTLGMMSFARGIAYWYTGATPIIWTSFPNTDLVYNLGAGNVAGIPHPTIVWIAVVFIFFVILRFTVLGRIIYSIGGNEEAVVLSGIDVTKWKAAPYIISGISCGIASIIITARLGVGSPMTGVGQELDSIAAVVIGGASMGGGIGTVFGTVIGALILGIINNILDLMNVPAYPQMMLKGLIVVLAVILASLRGKKSN
jgi:ribose transport system permease protein